MALANIKKSLKVCFMGGRQAGIIGALSLVSAGHRILSAVSYSKELSLILQYYDVPLCLSVRNKDFIEVLKKSDLLVSVHGREIIEEKYLHLPRLGSINIHPYLYKYKGTRPVERALNDGNFKASVGVHRMEKEIDAGDVIIEEFVDVEEAKTIGEIYNILYPYYSLALLKALEIITRSV